MFDKFLILKQLGLKHILFLLFLFFLFFGMNGCRSQKVVTTTDSAEEDIYTSCYPIESISIPTGRLEVSNGGQSISLNGSIYISRDSVCYFRGRVLLLEAVRGAIYHDSFVVVSYLERTLYRGKNEYLQRMTGFPVNPETLLMIFTDDKCHNLLNNRSIFKTEYDNYIDYGQFNLPSVVDISANDGRNNIRIKANFQQILLDQYEEINMNIPSNYRVVVLE